MRPADVVADPTLLERFQAEVAYRDGRLRDEDVRGYDAEVLNSAAGLLAVAWLWPDQSFAPEADPFELAARTSSTEWRARIAAQLQNVMRAAAEAVAAHGGPDFVDDILRYLEWQVELSEGDLVRLGAGEVDQLAIWVRICRSLHLEFSDTWRISDPARLSRRIEQARLAETIAGRLRGLPVAKLRDLWRSLPPRMDEPVSRLPNDVYHAPKGRYRGLYLELAQDERPRPTYSIEDINEILRRHHENPLPPSATTDTSWWAGRGSKTEGRPQVAAWWAAGYRIAESFGMLEVRRDNESLLHSDEYVPTDAEREEWSRITSIRFERLPGREEWLRNESRTEVGEYRMPERASIPLPPASAPRLVSAHVDVFLMGHQFPQDVIEWEPEAETGVATDPRGFRSPLGDAKDDAEVALLELLEAEGEMDREAIVRGLGEHSAGVGGRDAESFVPRKSRDVKVLLTRARRRGLIVNRGTNRKPRWVLAGSAGDLVLQIKQLAEARHEDLPPIELPRVGPGGAVPPSFLSEVAARIDVAVPVDASQSEVAKEIVQRANRDWHEDAFVSDGNTLTLEGWRAVAAAVDNRA
jgi:hypothetical protein